MKLRLFRFLTVFYVFFLLYEELRNLLRYPDKIDWGSFDFIDWLSRASYSSLLFLAYALFSYLFLFYRYRKQSRTITFLGISGIAFGVIGLRYLVEEVILKAIRGYGNYYDGFTTIYYIVDNLYYAMIYTAFGVCFFFVTYAVHRDRQQQELLLENKTTELAFLRSQVNPHFLFNMLNNIYSLINMGSDKALMATDKLSKLLRYSLYESDAMVTVEHEVQSVKDYISLQELRFRESVQTTISVDAQANHREIAPFLLMPLVENAFKHGVVTDGKNPVEIKIFESKSHLTIFIGNRIAAQEKDQVGGIGIENLRKRLQLIYTNRHTFVREIKKDRFEITIKIKGI